VIADDAVRAICQAATTDGEAFLARLYVRCWSDPRPASDGFSPAWLTSLGFRWVFHCAAGKDRTGMVGRRAAVVLGVDEEQVLDDYELTSRYQTSVKRR